MWQEIDGWLQLAEDIAEWWKVICCPFHRWTRPRYSLCEVSYFKLILMRGKCECIERIYARWGQGEGWVIEWKVVTLIVLYSVYRVCLHIWQSMDGSSWMAAACTRQEWVTEIHLRAYSTIDLILQTPHVANRRKIHYMCTSWNDPLMSLFKFYRNKCWKSLNLKSCIFLH